MQQAAIAVGAHIILMDLGPNLGSINRAALIAADYVVVPLAPDLFSLQGLRNLGPELQLWREEWQRRLQESSGKVSDEFRVPPSVNMKLIGYIVMQHAVRLDRPVQAYERWVRRIPGEYQRAARGARSPSTPEDVAVESGPHFSIADDPSCIALLKHYRSLMPLAQEARRPMFALRPGDGALGGHTENVRQAARDFKAISTELIKRCAPELAQHIA